MASHMSSLGFQVRGEREFGDLVNHALRNGSEIESAHGLYVWWTAGRGVELWIQVNQHSHVVGMNPHFRHSGRTRAGLTERIIRPEENGLDGAFHAWADPAGDDPTSGAYPFVFDAPDFDRHQELAPPAVRQVQLAAFAHELQLFPNERAYYESQETETRFAAEAFIPSGLLNLNGGPNGPPQAFAVFAGRVLAWEQITNPYTGRPFAWARVRTVGGEVDMVADPDQAQGGLVEGGIVWGSFWLSGRIDVSR